MRGGYLLGIGIQLFVTVGWPRAHNGNPAVGLPSIVFGYFINSVVPVWVPQTAVGPAVAWGGLALCLILFLPFALAAVLIGWFGSASQRVTAAGLLVLSVLIYAVSVGDNPNSFYAYATLSHTGLGNLWLARYGVVPSMMLCALLPIAVTALRERRRPSPVKAVETANSGTTGWTAEPRRRTVAARIGTATVLVLAIVLAVQFVPASTRRSAGPEWQPQVEASEALCQAVPATSMQFAETLGWHVIVPCARIG